MGVTIRDAMLFAAGLGTRLLPLTTHTPKPLIWVAGKPLIEYAFDRFMAAGVTRVVVNTHHLAEQVEGHLGRLALPVDLHISREETLLETGGGLVKALPWLNRGPFFSANTDTIWLDGARPALARLAEAFDPTRMDALLLLHPLSRAVGYAGPGNFALSGDGQLVRSESAPYVFTGLQVLHPRLFVGRSAEPWSLRELYREAEEEGGTLKRMYGLVHDGDWLHVGTPDELEAAESFFERRSRASGLPPAE